MNKKPQTYYAIINAREELPHDNNWHLVLADDYPAVGRDKLPFEPDTTHWLSEQQGVILSVEEWNTIEALLKSSEIAARINNLPELAGKIEQTLSQLNK